jgi:hypothetical protein
MIVLIADERTQHMMKIIASHFMSKQPFLANNFPKSKYAKRV